ncbi:hypothetical protein EPN96_04985 [bacterium]|nr:MAG: hypothetical protein EPN96_04985 [bacterium]
MAKKIEKKPVKNAQKIDPKMWACGEWLERFLNEDLRAKDFRELAEKAVKILDLQFEIKPNEPSLKLIEKMENSANPEKPFIDQWPELSQEIPQLSFSEGYAKFRFKRDPRIKSINDFQTEALAGAIQPVNVTIEGIRGVFKKLSEINKPWELALPEIVADKRDILLSGVLEHNVIGHSWKIASGYIIENGKMKFIRAFSFNHDDPRHIFEWNAVISMVFLTFLELGGQEYYSFCERCGKFTVVQRKGRKKFCSELCRVYAFNEKEEAEKAAKKSAR